MTTPLEAAKVRHKASGTQDIRPEALTVKSEHMATTKPTQESPPTFLCNFKPLSSLWDGEGAPYPSEASARWALRQMKADLANADALALHRGRLLVHTERFSAIVEKKAISAARRRLSLSTSQWLGEDPTA